MDSMNVDFQMILIFREILSYKSVFTIGHASVPDDVTLEVQCCKSPHITILRGLKVFVVKITLHSKYF